MSRCRLIFVNRVFTPDESATAQLLHDVATALAALSWPVMVITTGDEQLPRREWIQRVEVVRVRTISRGRGWLLLRGLHDVANWIRLAWLLRREVRTGDVVVAMTDPPLLGVGVAFAAGKQVPVYHWCQDIYPEVAMAIAGARWRRRLLEPFRWLRDASWRRAAGLVVLGDDMRQLVESRGVAPERITVSPNWPPLGTRPVNGVHLRRYWKLQGRFVVTYSGNLGRVHALLPLLDAAERLKDDARIVFLIIGHGAQRTLLERRAADRGLSNVIFYPPQPRLRLSEVLAASNLQVVALRPECVGTVWPSKFYGIVAAHRPVVFIGPPEAEVSQLVSKHGLGATFTPEDVAGVVDYILHMANNPDAEASTCEHVAAYSQDLPGLADALDTWIRLLVREEPPVTTGS